MLVKLLIIFYLRYKFIKFMPTVAFNICCPRDCVSRHNGGTSGAPLKPLRDDSALLIVFSDVQGVGDSVSSLPLRDSRSFTPEQKHLPADANHCNHCLSNYVVAVASTWLLWIPRDCFRTCVMFKFIRAGYIGSITTVP